MTDFFAQLAARYRGEANVLQPRVPFRFEPVAAALTPADPVEETAREFQRAPEVLAELLRQPTAAEFRHPPVRPAELDARDEPRDDPSVRSPADVRPLPGPAARERAPSRAERPEHAVPTGTVQASPSIAAAGPAAPWPGPAAAHEAQATSTVPERDVARGSRRSRDVANSDDPATGPDVDAEPGAGRAGRHPATPASRSRAGAGTPISPAASAPGRRQPSGIRSKQGRIAAAPPGPGGQESITVQVTIGRVEVRAAPPAPAERPASAPAAGPSLADYLRRRERSAGAPP
jgi:hypothetical protein